jgi:hypothetical protein
MVMDKSIVIHAESNRDDDDDDDEGEEYRSEGAH